MFLRKTSFQTKCNSNLKFEFQSLMSSSCTLKMGGKGTSREKCNFSSHRVNIEYIHIKINFSVIDLGFSVKYIYKQIYKIDLLVYSYVILLYKDS